jgi:hypothetical protein
MRKRCSLHGLESWMSQSSFSSSGDHSWTSLSCYLMNSKMGGGLTLSVQASTPLPIPSHLKVFTLKHVLGIDWDWLTMAHSLCLTTWSNITSLEMLQRSSLFPNPLYCCICPWGTLHSLMKLHIYFLICLSPVSSIKM